jgi:hypothetical protein
MAKKSTRAKKVSYDVIERQSDQGRPMYALLDRLIEQHHEDLSRTSARIVLAFCTSWKPDVDGRETLGKCKRATDLDRELSPFDFAILLNKTFWQNPRVSAAQREALLDHELHHAAVDYDEQGHFKRDERERYVFRTKRHDLEEFRDVVARHGVWKNDIEQFAQALRRAEGRTSSAWVGYTSLRETLAEVGVSLEVAVIATWSDAERREVMTWAQLQQDLGKIPKVVTSVSMPACLAFATRDPMDVTWPRTN